MNKVNHTTNTVASVSRIIKTTVIGIGLLISFSVSASSVQGGQMTLNINDNALAGAFTHNTDPNRPSFYIEEYFNAAQASSRTSSEILTTHIVPGTGQISGIGRQFTVNGSAVSGQNKATTLSFNADDLTGTASGVIGLGGALRYRLNIPFDIDPVTGEEEGNRVVNGYMTMEYDANRIDANTGASGWVLMNHHTFRADVFDLANVTTELTTQTLLISGDLALAGGINHFGGDFGAIVGDFNFQTTVVPIPAAIWLFGSALTGLGVMRRRQTKMVPQTLYAN